MIDVDRRHHTRGPIQSKARLTILDGPTAGITHDVLTRDQSMSGVSFLLRDELVVGQQCRVELETPARTYNAEVIRSRPISGNRYEMALQFEKPPEVAREIPSLIPVARANTGRRQMPRAIGR